MNATCQCVATVVLFAYNTCFWLCSQLHANIFASDDRKRNYSLHLDDIITFLSSAHLHRLCPSGSARQGLEDWPTSLMHKMAESSGGRPIQEARFKAEGYDNLLQEVASRLKLGSVWSKNEATTSDSDIETVIMI